MSEPAGIIDPSKIYTLRAIQAQSGLGSWALKTLRRSHGLRVLRFGGRGFVRGADFVAAIEAANAAEAQG